MAPLLKLDWRWGFVATALTPVRGGVYCRVTLANNSYSKTVVSISLFEKNKSQFLFYNILNLPNTSALTGGELPSTERIPTISFTSSIAPICKVYPSSTIVPAPRIILMTVVEIHTQWLTSP